MDTKKLVTFAFATPRRKLAMVTLGVLTAGGSLLGGGGDKAPPTSVPAKASAPAPAATVPASTKCDGVHFNVAVEPGDPRDRDGDGLACER